MKFNDLDSKMRIYETQNDYCVSNDSFLVVRLDGRGFSKLTEKKFKKPFDHFFNMYMRATVYHLMNCGFNFSYAYTESDEISLLLKSDENIFNRKTRKLISILASEAGAAFSLEADCLCAFDCRVSELPTKDLVIDYFRWRQEDCKRNALNSYCYWTLRNNDKTAVQANSLLKKKSFNDKINILKEYCIDFNNSTDVPLHQKNGIGAYWTMVVQKGFSPLTTGSLPIHRRELFFDVLLPTGNDYSQYLETKII